MRFFIILITISLIPILFIGCGGSKELSAEREGVEPAWFLNVLQDPNYFFATSTAASNDLQFSLNKATTDARAEVSRQIEVRVSTLQKRFQEEVGIAEDARFNEMMTQVTRTVTDNALHGSRVRDQTYMREGQLYRAYVLVEYPIGEANAALMKQLKENEYLQTLFRGSQLFEELDEEIKKYEEWKQRQVER